MDFSHRLAISYYKTIAVINESHKIYLVQHQETNKIYIKKILDIYNLTIYKHLYANPIIGTPKVVDYLEENQQLVVIEEFISGTSLQDKIEQKELSLSDILNYMLDLCTILEQLHVQNPPIIHRDVKPSNVIITNYNRAVLLDFNAAKYYSKQSNEDTILLGTQGYAAPEQYGFGSSSPQTDIYSLGILFQEMLKSINYSSEKTNCIVSKCTQMNPSERYDNAEELRGDISLCINPEPNGKKPQDTGKYTLPGFRTKTPWKMLLASLNYLFITWLCLSLDIKDTYGLALWLERSTIYAIMLSIIFCSFNYLNIQKLIPLCQHPNRLIRYLGIAILDILIMFGLLLILCIIEALCFPT